MVRARQAQRCFYIEDPYNKKEATMGRCKGTFHLKSGIWEFAMAMSRSSEAGAVG